MFPLSFSFLTHKHGLPKVAMHGWCPGAWHRCLVQYRLIYIYIILIFMCIYIYIYIYIHIISYYNIIYVYDVYLVYVHMYMIIEVSRGTCQRSVFFAPRCRDRELASFVPRGQDTTRQISRNWESFGKRHWESIGQFQWESTGQVTILWNVLLTSEIQLENATEHPSGNAMISEVSISGVQSFAPTLQ